MNVVVATVMVRIAIAMAKVNVQMQMMIRSIHVAGIWARMILKPRKAAETPSKPAGSAAETVRSG